MSRKLAWLLCLTFVLPAVSATALMRMPAPATAAAPDVELAQSYSTKCQTMAGLCFVAAQALGAPCTCPNGQIGNIIP